ncbi:MAG: hypothetical protein IT424_01620 [Pirellulales bacterium]|nr:hypothetical protein [Pirellulales bacterium]
MRKLSSLAATLALAALASHASAIEVNPVVTDVGTSNLFTGGPISAQRVSFNNNVVRAFRINGTANGEAGNGGGGFVLAVSNGENGRDVTAGPGPGGSPVNSDKPNPTPVGFSIAAVNGGGRIQNGNAFRFSVWMQQDPDNPVTKELGVEPVLKFELWSEAQSTYADYNGTALYPAFGDRLWDTDINGRNTYFEPYNQSQSSFVDINNNGTLINGFEPVASLPPATGEQWVRVETTLIIDDHPDDSTFGWQIEDAQYFVDDIEEVRATFFMGDFTGNGLSLANGGRIFVDNALMEIFPDEATMLATPNPNPTPQGLAGDFDQDVDVDGNDFLAWQRGFPFPYTAADLTAWKNNFGATGSAGVHAAVVAYAAAGQGIPEPGAGLLALAAVVAAAALRIHNKSACQS